MVFTCRQLCLAFSPSVTTEKTAPLTSDAVGSHAAQNMKPRGQCPKPLITKGFTEGKKQLAILQWGCAYWIKPLVSWVQVKDIGFI